MPLRHRPMWPRDVAECARIIGAHPVIGPRYGDAIVDLRRAWLCVLECEARAAAVIEEVEGPRATICFVGMSVFVRDEFMRELKSPPLFWFGPELIRRIIGGNSPLLTGKELREANSCGGLNLLIWEGCIRPEFWHHPEIHRKSVIAFHEHHCGYLWKEVIAAQMESADQLNWILKTGGLLWDAAKGRYMESLEKDAHEIIREPHIAGMTREAERSRPGSWAGAIFDYHPPQMEFSQGEQQLLLAALSGRTDEELCDYLGAALSTIKNTWRSIYNRAASRLPELFPGAPQANAPVYLRGKEKRRRLLGYLREHPEELRPVSRKLLQKSLENRSPRRVISVSRTSPKRRLSPPPEFN